MQGFSAVEDSKDDTIPITKERLAFGIKISSITLDLEMK